MSRTEIRITGFGGQGVVLSGHIIGHAYAVCAGNHATMIQSFGPEARGSACSATLVASDEEVLAGLPPMRTVFIGDSRTDFDTARAAGCLSVLVTFGMRPRDEVIGYGGDATVDALGELVELLVACLEATPAWCRLSRVIRDFSAHDIEAGSRVSNLREVAERRLAERGGR